MFSIKRNVVDEPIETVEIEIVQAREKIPEIVNEHCKQGGNQADQNTQFKAIFFEYHSFQDFSILFFRT